MKIFSNFDTELDQKTYQRYAERYGKEKIYIIFKDKFFFILKVILPLVLYFLLALIAFLAIYFLDLGEEAKSYLRMFFLFVLIISIFAVGRKILVNMIDYKMDFIIVTPDEIISYDQTGILGRTSRSLDVDKLKTISVHKEGFLRSFFNYGKLVFLSEGDTRNGDIDFNFTPSPDSTKYKIKKIIETYSNYSKDL